MIVAAPTFLVGKSASWETMVCLYRWSLKWCCRIAAYSLWMNKDTNLPRKTIRKDSVMGNYRMEHLLCRRNLTFGVNSDTRIKRKDTFDFFCWSLILQAHDSRDVCPLRIDIKIQACFLSPFTRKQCILVVRVVGCQFSFNKQRTLLKLKSKKTSFCQSAKESC